MVEGPRPAFPIVFCISRKYRALLVMKYFIALSSINMTRIGKLNIKVMLRL